MDSNASSARLALSKIFDAAAEGPVMIERLSPYLLSGHHSRHNLYPRAPLEGGEEQAAWLHLAHETLNFLSAGLWALAFVSLLRKLHRDRNGSDLSLQTLFSLAVTEIINMVVIMTAALQFDVNLSPYLLATDAVICGLSVAVYIIAVKQCASSYESWKDNFGSRLLCMCLCTSRRRKREETGHFQHANQGNGTGDLPLASPLRKERAKANGKGTRLSMLSSLFPFCTYPHWLGLYVLAAVFAVPIQLARRHSLPLGISYAECYTDTLKAFALLPQLYMFYGLGESNQGTPGPKSPSGSPPTRRRQRRVSGLLGQFVACIVMSKLFNLSYWATDVWFHGTELPGRGVHIGTEIVTLLLLLDFAYYYSRSKRLGQRDVTLPI